MSIVDEVKDVLKGAVKRDPLPEGLAKLQEFLRQMRDAGVVRVREYDLPPPDTIGRALARFQKREL